MQPLRLSEQLAVGMAVFDAAGDKFGRLVQIEPRVLVVEVGIFFPTD